MTGPNEAMTALLAPRRVAVVGATPRAGAVGNNVISHAAGPRFSGDLVAVNPGYDEVEGRACFASLEAIPDVPDCAVMAVGDNRIEAAVEDAARAGVKGLVLLGRLYEPEDDGVALRARVGAVAREAGMAVCGGNCMGFFNTADDVRLSMSNLPNLDIPGNIGLLSHSGSTWSGMGGNLRQMRFSVGVSMGFELTTGVGDYVEYLVSRPETSAIAMVLETVRDGEQFLGAVEAANDKGIPVVALKLGRSAKAREFALSHSGALAGDDRVYDAVFRRHNVIGVHTLDEMLDTLEMVSCGRIPAAGSVGIQTDSGGERQLITDLAADFSVPLTSFSTETQAALTDVLDPGLEPENPVDYWGEGGLPVTPQITRILGDAPEVGLVAFATNMVSNRVILFASTEALEAVHASTDKPCVMLGNLTSTIDPGEAARLREKGIPVLMGTETGLKAMGHFLAWHKRRDERHEHESALDKALVEAWRTRLTSGELAPEVMLELISAFGARVPRSVVAENADEVAGAAREVGYPVVLKTADPKVLHKTDVGGVVLGLGDEASLLTAYDTMSAALGSRALVQETAQPGIEMLVGMKNDETFGPVMTVAMGGVLVEVLNDAVTFVPPVSTDEADALVRTLRASALLDGVRGRPAGDREALSQTISDLSFMVAALGDLIGECDVNPLLVHEKGVTAVDALITPHES
ncbi:MAG: acetate--CoA ligase family protein [Alphaproteobacteria bacterium]|jgi:acyl-CoA synthetase (NDP forming)